MALQIEDDPEIFADRGNSYFYLGEYEAAVNDYNNAILRDANNMSAFAGRGRAKFMLKKFDQAINDLN